MGQHHKIPGEWYDSGTSRQRAAWLSWNGEGRLSVQDAVTDDLLISDTIAEWQISARLGRTTRFLAHREGGRFSTLEQDRVDELQQGFQASFLTRVVHRLESRKRFVALALIIALAVGWLMVARGVPALAMVLAERVPESAVQQLTRETLFMADRLWFVPSQLEPAQKIRLHNHFAPVIADHPHLNIKVLFRGGGPLEANAVALPDGTIVMTDELVHLAEDDDELTAILLHEIGHIEHRHGLRSVFQSSILGVALVWLTGDASATAEIFLGAPLIINELSYSRRFEFEADDYARDYMLAHDIPLVHFHNILWRLTQGGTFNPETDLIQSDSKDPISSYLLTHPPALRRIERFQPQ